MNPSWVHTAGDTLDMLVTCEYLSTEGWTLTYYLVPRFTTPVQAPIAIACAGNADGTYQLQAGPAATAGWTPGTYGWHRRVAKAGNSAVQTLTGAHDQGELLVRANPATLAQGADSRSQARKAVDDLKAAMATFQSTSGRVKSYSIGNRQMEFETTAEIVKMLNFWQLQLDNEEDAAALQAGLGTSRKIYTRFDRA